MAAAVLAVVLSSLAVVLAPVAQAAPSPTLHPGDLVVGDAGNERILVFPKGGGDTWVFAEGVGQITDVAVARDGRVYAALGDALVVYSPAGELLNFRFADATMGVAVRDDGQILMTDAGGGNLDRGFGNADVVELLNGDLSDPHGVAVASDGDILVGDRSAGLKRLDKDGALLSTATYAISADWVAEAPNGDVWLTDHDDDKVYENGVAVLDATDLDAPNDVATSDDGEVVVADGGHDRLMAFDGDDWSELTPTNLSAMDNPTGLAVVPEPGSQTTPGDVFVADPETSRVLRFPAGGGSPVTVGSGLRSPQGVAVDDEGNVYIADQPNALIDAGDTNGHLVKVSADGMTQTVLADDLTVPWGVATDEDHVYVSDFSFTGGVYRMDFDGGDRETVDTGAFIPAGIAVDPEGNLWVSDPYSSLDPDHRVVARKVPADGGDPTELVADLSFGTGIDTDANGDVILPGSFGTASVLVPSGDGVPVPIGPTHTSPWGGAVTPDGHVLVADAGAGRITSFDLDSGDAGDDLGDDEFPTPGDDQDDYQGPYDVAVFAPRPDLTSSAPDAGTVDAAYSFTHTADAAATYKVVDGDLPDGLTLSSGGVLSGTPTAAGDFTFTLQAGNAATARLVPETVTIAKAAQVVAFTSPPPAAAGSGDTYAPTASHGGSGNLVVFSVAPGSAEVCHATAGVITFDLAGDCVIRADQAGSDDYLAATTVEQTVTVGKHSQTLVFLSDPPEDVQVGDTYRISAQGGGSGNQVGFSVAPNPAGACTIDVDLVTFLHVGQCVINAYQGGSDDYLPAPPSSQAVGIGPAGQTVAFTSTPPSGAVVGQKYHPTVSSAPVDRPAAIAASGACSLVGGVVELVHAGTCTVTATMAGDADHTEALATQAIPVSKAPTELALSVGATSLTASIDVPAPGAGRPTGSVAFAVDGSSVGSADLGADGTAVLPTTIPSGADHTVTASYAGSADFGASADSAERRDPTISASPSSKRSPSHGWFRKPVTVDFTCTPTTAALVGPCPAPVRLTRETPSRTVTRSVTALDGGKGVVEVVVRIDRTAPTVRVVGPRLRCVVIDELSGPGPCQVIKHPHRYKAIGFDRAGNRTVVRRRRG